MLLLALWLPASGQTNTKNYIISRSFKQAGANINDLSKVATQVQYSDPYKPCVLVRVLLAPTL